MTTPDTLRGVAVDALHQRGFTRDQAEEKINEFADAVLAGSDHLSYRVLADAVGDVLKDIVPPGTWSARGGKTELADLRRLIAWLPDMVRHNLCDKIRSQAVGGRYASDWADPFIRNSGGQWIRKSDGAPVPWPVVTD